MDCSEIPLASAPLVSVIVLCYNQQDKVERALRSVACQDLDAPFEIVVADDCSSDASAEVCRRFADSFQGRATIRILRRDRNLGLVLNYFDALRNCRGRYIADCAADDEWTSPSRLSALTAMLEERPDANVAFSEYVSGSKGSPVNPYGTPAFARWNGAELDPSALLHDILDHKDSLPYLLSAAIYRRDAAMRLLRADDERRALLGDSAAVVCNPDFGCEDFPLMTALAADGGKALHLPEATVSYDDACESISHSADPARMARFYAKSLYATAVLADHYGVPQESLTGVFRAQSLYVVSQARLSRDRDVLREALRAVGRWRLPLPFKARLHLLAARIFSR